MNSLRNQMASLVSTLSASTLEREKAVEGIRSQTAQMLQTFGRERKSMARSLRHGLAVDSKARTVEVASLRLHTQKLCDSFRQGHARMRRSLRQTLTQSKKSVINTVTSLRVDFSKEMVAVAAAHRQMASTQSLERATDRQQRAQEANALLQNFHTSRVSMAHELTSSLAKTVQQIKAQVSDLGWLTPAPAPAKTQQKAAKTLGKTASSSQASARSETFAVPAVKPHLWPSTVVSHAPEAAPAAAYDEKIEAEYETAWNQISKPGKSKKK